MIATLRGIIRQKSPPNLLIEVNHIGYEIQAPMSTFYHLPEVDEPILLYTHLVIREDAHQLYGFYQARDRDLFRLLVKINGVGPKLALAILSALEPKQFMQTVTERDVTRLTQVPGIGKKTAERLIIECQSTLQKWQLNHSSDNSLPLKNDRQDAIDALSTLGYKPTDAKRAVEAVYHAGQKTEELIRQALQHMVKGVS